MEENMGNLPVFSRRSFVAFIKNIIFLILAFVTPSLSATAATLPPPALVSPRSGSAPGPNIFTTTPTFQWQSVSGADGYALYISKFNGSSYEKVFDSQDMLGVPITGTSYTLPSGYLLNGGQYRWNMASHNSAGYGNPNADRLYFSVFLPDTTQCDINTPPVFGLTIITHGYGITSGLPNWEREMAIAIANRFGGTNKIPIYIMEVYRKKAFSDDMDIALFKDTITPSDVNFKTAGGAIIKGLIIVLIYDPLFFSSV